MRLNLQDSIVKTLSYSSIFDFPLKSNELWERLIGHKASEGKLKTTLNKLVADKKIFESSGYYSTKPIKPLITKRKIRENISSIKLKKATSLGKLLALHPHILAIFITGSLAVNNSADDDDIDLMIVTKDGSLWTTRLVLTPLLDLLGLRRRPKVGRFKDLLCLNIYLSPASLKLPKNSRNIYTAYELIQAVPIVDKDSIRDKLLASNTWITDFLPNTTISDIKFNHVKSRAGTLENFAYSLQLKYMSPKKTIEKVTPNSAFFHPRDLSTDIISKLEGNNDTKSKRPNKKASKS